MIKPATPSESRPRRQFWQPLDRIALPLIALLAALAILLLLNGDHTAPRVREFSWQNKQIGAEDAAFILTFSRPMNQASVEDNLRLEPPLLGKVSWAGRRMAYTLNTPAPYGTSFQVQLQGARDRFAAEGSPRSPIRPFTAEFRTRDRAFAYIGIEGEEEGRLILYNLTRQKKAVLTPKELVVVDFRSYPEGDKLLFSATDRASTQPKGFLEQKLYTITTGLHYDSPPDTSLGAAATPTSQSSPTTVGKMDLILDSDQYQNLKFDLSSDGQTIVIQRVNRDNPADFGPWVLRAGEKPKPLNQKGGDFIITPDSQSLAITQGQGLAIVPLQPNAKALDFLPKFGMVLSFARDGRQATMVKYNTDYTRSLFLVTNQGVQKELLKTTGSIISTQFDPSGQILYCLLTRLIPGQEYQEQPFLAIVELKNAELTPLLLLPNQQNIQMQLAPDGLGILFDQITTSNDRNQQSGLRDDAGRAVIGSQLWLLPLVGTDVAAQAKIQPESLPLTGLRPRWLP